MQLAVGGRVSAQLTFVRINRSMSRSGVQTQLAWRKVTALQVQLHIVQNGLNGKNCDMECGLMTAEEIISTTFESVIGLDL